MEGIFVLIIIGVFCYFVWRDESYKNSIHRINGKEYQWKCVGMDVKKSYQDSIQATLGNISKSELLRREKNDTYAINAWVEVGKPKYTWKEDPINKDIFLCYADDYEYLPKYLQTPDMKLVKEYRGRKNERVPLDKI